jgi:hypothetical protein
MEKHVVKLRATLDEGLRSRNQWIQEILLVESFKLVPRPLDECPRPKSDKLSLIWHLFWRENQLVGTKRQCLKESSWFGEPRIRLGTQVHSNSRIQFASHESKLVPRKSDPGPSPKVSLMIFYYKTGSTPYLENHNQHDWHLVQSANMLDPWSEALA